MTDTEKYIEDRKISALKEVFKSMKENWEINNPPKFKYGNSVNVSEKDEFYMGTIVSIVSMDLTLLPGKVSGDLKFGYEYTYCIDTGDMKPHTAKEPQIELIADILQLHKNEIVSIVKGFSDVLDILKKK